MSNHKSGVATIIQSEEPRAVYTHCYGHALSLACSDSIKNYKCMKDALDTSYELVKLVKKSPRRDAMLQKKCQSTLPYKVDSQSTSITQHSCQL